MAKVNKAICITLGEQSENHVGMKIQGKGLSKNGYSKDDLIKFQKKFEELNCKCEFLDISYEDNNAYVLIIRDCINKISQINNIKTDLLDEMINLDWDKTYYDRRRQKVLNKRARYNLCFGDKYIAPDMYKGQGTIIDLKTTPILQNWKNKMEEILEEDKLECEGNYYYDAKKCYIGYHGDSERKKVVACSLSTDDIVREIRWKWFYKSEQITEPFSVLLNKGDSYIMSEKATGFDWKKRNLYTLRHAAAVPDSKYL